MGSLELYIGCMFAGKTERLRDTIHRERFRHEHTEEHPTVALFKPVIDTRYGLPTDMISHNDTKTPCIPVSSAEEINKYLCATPALRVLGIDEIQFLDGAIISLCVDIIRHRDIRVFASGLNLDFRGDLFRFRDSENHMGELMGYAQHVHPLSAFCAYRSEDGKRCTEEAYFTQRLFADGTPVPYGDPLVFVGGKDTLHERRYEARCGRHHQVPERPIILSTSQKETQLPAFVPGSLTEREKPTLRNLLRLMQGTEPR